MGKDGRGTEHAVAHSDIRDPLHETHKTQQRKRKATQVLRKASGIRWRQFRVAPAGDYPLFESKLSRFLGDGETYRIQRDANGEICGIKPEDGGTWQADLNRWIQDMTWYSVSKRLKSGNGWTRRKIRDRTRLSPGDKRPRPDSDVMRRTNELRPDHSRALQKICERGHTADAVALVEQFCWRSVKRWEELNPGRRVDHVGLHADSGQLHRDVWHSGIVEVKDDSAPKGIRRNRTPYRVYGVGPGACAFSRHLTVMEEEFGALIPSAEVTREIVESDITTATAQNECAPRDLAYQEWLDKWIDQRLREIDADAVTEARREYAEHLRTGYRTGKLGYLAAKSKFDSEIEKLTRNLMESKAAERRQTEIIAEQEAKLFRLEKLYDESQSKCEVLQEQHARAESELTQIREAAARAAKILPTDQFDPVGIIDELGKQLKSARTALHDFTLMFKRFLKILWESIPLGIDELRKIIKFTADERGVDLPEPEQVSPELKAGKPSKHKSPPPSGLEYPQK